MMVIYMDFLSKKPIGVNSIVYLPYNLHEIGCFSVMYNSTFYKLP